MDNEEAQYRQCVYDIWATAKLAHTFHNELIDVMFENGFLIETVTVCVTDCETITWKGRCYDADLVDYKFTAEWKSNFEKFTASIPHYYDLACLDIEPVEAQ